MNYLKFDCGKEQYNMCNSTECVKYMCQMVLLARCEILQGDVQYSFGDLFLLMRLLLLQYLSTFVTEFIYG